MTPSRLLLFALALSLASGCAVIQQDEVGVKRVFGELKTQTLQPGFYFLEPISTDMLRLPTHTQNLEVKLDLPSQEGVTVASEISILYRIDPKRAHEVLRMAGQNYEREIILSIFRSASADVCSRFMAKDMHSGARSKIEHAIQKRMTDLIGNRGFVIEAVLMKSIKLPERLARSIESRLESEQEAMRMQFVLDRERQEAQRKLVAAKGERDAQKIRAEGLTNEILRLRAIEAFIQLAQSPNAKVIITGAESPLMAIPPGELTPELSQPSTPARKPANRGRARR